jgi:uncharacterized phage protein (TIGR02218 family)
MSVKGVPSALLTTMAGGSPTLAFALRITRTDGAVYGFTSASKSATISGVIYDASQGLSISSIATTIGLNVDNLELSTLNDGSLFTREAVLGGVWQNAAFLIFRYNWATLGDGVEYLMAGTVGGVTLRDGQVVAELRGLQQYLQQPVGSMTSKTCRARVGDHPTPAGNNRCRLDVATITSVITVSAVTSLRQFTATGSPMTEDWYGNGVLTWATGNNAGLRAVVRSQTAGGVFVLYADMPYAITIGDTINAVAGCRGRLDEDCATKFANEINFAGEPHVPMVDALTAAPEVAG